MPGLAALGIRVLEVIPPAVDTELNPQGRAGRPRGSLGLGLVAVHEYAASVVKGLLDDVPEIGFGYTQDLPHGGWRVRAGHRLR